MPSDQLPSGPVDADVARVARAIEHTLLRADASAQQIARLCEEAVANHFYCVCVNGNRVLQACTLLENTVVKVAGTVGFPLGAGDLDVKRFETEVAIDHGAHEIDLVMDIGRFREGDFAYVRRELRDVVEAADERPVKVIIEACLLTPEEKISACKLIIASGAQVVKTSTGFGQGGATLEDVRLLRETVGPIFGVKAAGGIREASQALALLDAGANRLGSSAGVSILRQLKNQPTRPEEGRERAK